MPITSNWIWPKLGTPWMVIFFISTMFISMAFGIICIKIFKHLNRHTMALELIYEQKSATPTMSKEAVSDVQIIVEQNELGIPISNANIIPHPPLRQHMWLKYLHGFFMFYSYVMILGAAGAFGSNARTHNFPYKETETNQLYGRCYGRNLNESSAPEWLTSLDCGVNAWCKVSATNPSEMNPYYKNP